MTTTTTRRFGALAAIAIAVAACGSDDAAEPTDGATAETSDAAPATEAATDDTVASAGTTATVDTAGEEPTGTDADATDGSSAPGVGASLADVCPDPMVIQTDWFPEAEHGALYELVGDDYEVDVDARVVRGSMVAGGEETGIGIEVRTGGPAIGGQTVAAEAYSDDDITLAYANTEAQVLQFDATPLVSVVAPLEINPQIIYWDPATYPDVETLADLGDEEVTINIFGGGVFSDVFVANGTWSEDQVDPSYDGSPARFISEDGAIAQQGFASAEPYSYEEEFEEWGQPVAFQTLHDAGFEVYSQTLAARPDDIAELSDCLSAFVPMVQQAAIDFIEAPDRANAIIIDAVESYDDFWQYSDGLARYSVETQRELGLVGNGPDDTLGDMEEDRIQTVIEQIRDDAGLDVSPDLVATDLFTNEFIDPSIGM
ncbi:ABC transporter substrate-binding protein [Ilumatobacter sp.]|uniref:ABC transporter substrate-binding protein n=1 Tax=Ilumatobacter sp. TaxID=1967498 RepID=UPI003B51874A